MRLFCALQPVSGEYVDDGRHLLNTHTILSHHPVTGLLQQFRCCPTTQSPASNRSSGALLPPSLGPPAAVQMLSHHLVSGLLHQFRCCPTTQLRASCSSSGAVPPSSHWPPAAVQVLSHHSVTGLIAAVTLITAISLSSCACQLGC